MSSAGEMNEYEKERLENIERNKRRLAALNIPEIVNNIEQQCQPRKIAKVCLTCLIHMYNLYCNL